MYGNFGLSLSLCISTLRQVSMSSSSKKPSNLIQKTPGSQPFFQVFLTDWWLIEVESNSEGRRLGVAGFPSRGRQAIREFKSTAIIKRHDAVTLETEDGITVTITNGMNMFRTLQNGFHPEMCSHFLSGFPYNWEEFADKCGGQKCTNKTGTSRAIHVNHVGTSLDDLPVAHVRDILMLSSGDTARCLIEKCISNLILRKQGGNIIKDNVNFSKPESKRKRQEDDTNDSSRVVAGDLSDNATSKIQNASKVEKSKDKGDALCSTDPKKATICEEYDTNDKNQLKIGDLSDDAILKSQTASTVEEKSKDKGGETTREEDDNNEKSLLASGDFLGDATLKTQNTSKNEEKCKDECGSVCLKDTKKENTPKVKAMRGRSIDKSSSRRVTTRSMSRLNNSRREG